MSARKDPRPHKALQICADSGEGGELTDLTWHPGLMYARPSEGTEAAGSEVSRLDHVGKIITLLSGCFL